MRRDGFVSGTLSPNLQNRMETSSCWEEQEFQWFPSSLQLEAVQLLAWLEAGSTSPGGPLPQGGVGRPAGRRVTSSGWQVFALSQSLLGSGLGWPRESQFQAVWLLTFPAAGAQPISERPSELGWWHMKYDNFLLKSPGSWERRECVCVSGRGQCRQWLWRGESVTVHWF